MLHLGGAAAPFEAEQEQAAGDDQGGADGQAGKDVAAGERQVTDDAGRYTFAAVPPGIYKLTTTLQGFSTGVAGIMPAPS